MTCVDIRFKTMEYYLFQEWCQDKERVAVDKEKGGARQRKSGARQRKSGARQRVALDEEELHYTKKEWR